MSELTPSQAKDEKIIDKNIADEEEAIESYQDAKEQLSTEKGRARAAEIQGDEREHKKELQELKIKKSFREMYTDRWQAVHDKANGVDHFEKKDFSRYTPKELETRSTSGSPTSPRPNGQNLKADQVAQEAEDRKPLEEQVKRGEGKYYTSPENFDNINKMIAENQMRIVRDVNFISKALFGGKDELSGAELDKAEMIPQLKAAAQRIKELTAENEELMKNIGALEEENKDVLAAQRAQKKLDEEFPEEETVDPVTKMKNLSEAINERIAAADSILTKWKTDTNVPAEIQKNRYDKVMLIGEIKELQGQIDRLNEKIESDAYKGTLRTARGILNKNKDAIRVLRFPTPGIIKLFKDPEFRAALTEEMVGKGFSLAELNQDFIRLDDNREGAVSLSSYNDPRDTREPQYDKKTGRFKGWKENKGMYFGLNAKSTAGNESRRHTPQDSMVQVEVKKDSSGNPHYWVDYVTTIPISDSSEWEYVTDERGIAQTDANGHLIKRPRTNQAGFDRNNDRIPGANTASPKYDSIPNGNRSSVAGKRFIKVRFNHEISKDEVDKTAGISINGRPLLYYRKKVGNDAEGNPVYEPVIKNRRYYSMSNHGKDLYHLSRFFPHHDANVRGVISWMKKNAEKYGDASPFFGMSYNEAADLAQEMVIYNEVFGKKYPIALLNEDGSPYTLTDENGNPLPMIDDNGKVVIDDKTGKPRPATAEYPVNGEDNGKVDEKGNRVANIDWILPPINRDSTKELEKIQADAARGTQAELLTAIRKTIDAMELMGVHLDFSQFHFTDNNAIYPKRVNGELVPPGMIITGVSPNQQEQIMKGVQAFLKEENKSMLDDDRISEYMDMTSDNYDALNDFNQSIVRKLTDVNKGLGEAVGAAQDKFWKDNLKKNGIDLDTPAGQSMYFARNRLGGLYLDWDDPDKRRPMMLKIYDGNKLIGEIEATKKNIDDFNAQIRDNIREEYGIGKKMDEAYLERQYVDSAIRKNFDEEIEENYPEELYAVIAHAEGMTGPVRDHWDELTQMWEQLPEEDRRFVRSEARDQVWKKYPQVFNMVAAGYYRMWQNTSDRKKKTLIKKYKAELDAKRAADAEARAKKENEQWDAYSRAKAYNSYSNLKKLQEVKSMMERWRAKKGLEMMEEAGLTIDPKDLNTGLEYYNNIQAELQGWRDDIEKQRQLGKLTKEYLKNKNKEFQRIIEQVGFDDRTGDADLWISSALKRSRDVKNVPAKFSNPEELVKEARRKLENGFRKYLTPDNLKAMEQIYLDMAEKYPSASKNLTEKAQNVKVLADVMSGWDGESSLLEYLEAAGEIKGNGYIDLRTGEIHSGNKFNFVNEAAANLRFILYSKGDVTKLDSLFKDLATINDLYDAVDKYSVDKERGYNKLSPEAQSQIEIKPKNDVETPKKEPQTVTDIPNVGDDGVMGPAYTITGTIADQEAADKKNSERLSEERRAKEEEAKKQEETENAGRKTSDEVTQKELKQIKNKKSTTEETSAHRHNRLVNEDLKQNKAPANAPKVPKDTAGEAKNKQAKKTSETADKLTPEKAQQRGEAQAKKKAEETKIDAEKKEACVRSWNGALVFADHNVIHTSFRKMYGVPFKKASIITPSSQKPKKKEKKGLSSPWKPKKKELVVDINAAKEAIRRREAEANRNPKMTLLKPEKNRPDSKDESFLNTYLGSPYNPEVKGKQNIKDALGRMTDMGDYITALDSGRIEPTRFQHLFIKMLEEWHDSDYTTYQEYIDWISELPVTEESTKSVFYGSPLQFFAEKYGLVTPGRPMTYYDMRTTAELVALRSALGGSTPVGKDDNNTEVSETPLTITAPTELLARDSRVDGIPKKGEAYLAYIFGDRLGGKFHGTTIDDWIKGFVGDIGDVGRGRERTPRNPKGHNATAWINDALDRMLDWKRQTGTNFATPTPGYNPIGAYLGVIESTKSLPEKTRFMAYNINNTPQMKRIKRITKLNNALDTIHSVTEEQRMQTTPEKERYKVTPELESAFETIDADAGNDSEDDSSGYKEWDSTQNMALNHDFTPARVTSKRGGTIMDAVKQHFYVPLYREQARRDENEVLKPMIEALEGNNRLTVGRKTPEEMKEMFDNATGPTGAKLSWKTKDDLQRLVEINERDKINAQNRLPYTQEETEQTRQNTANEKQLAEQSQVNAKRDIGGMRPTKVPKL